MVCTLGESSNRLSCCVSRSAVYWIARVLFPGLFIILIHYICFSDGPFHLMVMHLLRQRDVRIDSEKTGGHSALVPR
jgi:hypothetical protein